jgi:hypothetical protein
MLLIANGVQEHLLGRGGETRTLGFYFPKVARYQLRHTPPNVWLLYRAGQGGVKGMTPPIVYLRPARRVEL